MSGLLGPNTFRARLRHYAGCRGGAGASRPQDVRRGRRPRRQAAAARARGRSAVASTEYHPACIFKSFERAAYKTKTLERVDDVEGFENLQDADRADLWRELRHGALAARR